MLFITMIKFEQIYFLQNLSKHRVFNIESISTTHTKQNTLSSF